MPLIAKLPAHLVALDNLGGYHPGATPAAVAAVLFQRDGDWRIPFVVRRQDLPHHPGQVAFPGGRLRQSEEAWPAAAREVEEELGVPAERLQPLGAGPVVYAFVSNHSVLPFVAWLPDPPPEFTPDPGELQAVIEVPLERLLDPRDWIDSGDPRLRRYFPWGDTAIWGLTAWMLADLLDRIRTALA